MLGAHVATRHRITDELARHAVALPEAWEDVSLLRDWIDESFAAVAPKTLAARVLSEPLP